MAFAWDAEHPISNPSAGTVRNILRFSKLEVVALAFPAHTWYYLPTEVTRSTRLLAIEASGESIRNGLSQEMRDSLATVDVPSLLVSSFTLGQGWSGRIIFLNSALSAGDRYALRSLQRIMKDLSPALESVRRRNEISTRAGTRYAPSSRGNCTMARFNRR